MTIEQAASILSAHTHRDERTWWVKTSQEFVAGSLRVTKTVVACRAIELEPEEACAIAAYYGSK